MRDYAELVKALRYCSEQDNCGSRCPKFDRGENCRDEIETEAAAAIEELLAALPHWISVEEQLPEIERSVLLFNGAVHIGWRVDGKRFRFLSDKYPDHPTHWMPLPEPPKEVE